MNIQESIRRIINEDIKIPIYILRRLDFSSLSDQMKEGVLRNFNKHASLDTIIDSASEYVASEIIPWEDPEENVIPEEDLNNWVKTLKEYIFHKYGEETKEYVKRVLPNSVFNDDGNIYVFYKHSEQNGGSGFSESFDTWGDLILGFGSWFPLDWNEIKSDLDEMDEGKKIILKPNDKHNNYRYYFSIIKKKSNLQESIKKTLRKELPQIIDNNQQIKEGLPNRTKELILDKVKTMGFDAAASIVGGKDNLSKITGINTYEEYLNLFNDLTISPSQERPGTTLYKNDKGINVFVHYYGPDPDMYYVFINDSILQKPFSMDVIDHKPYHTKNSLTYEQKGRVLRKWLNDTYGIQVKNMDYLHNYYPGEENAGGYLEYLK